MLSLCFLVIVLYTSVVVASSTVGNREKLKKVGKAGNSAVANKLGPLLNSRTAGKNLIYSPTSIWSALSTLTPATLSTDDRQLLQKFLAIDTLDDESNLTDFFKSFNQQSENITVSLANSVWTGLEFEQAVLTESMEVYLSSYYRIHQDDLQSSFQELKSWISNKTNDLIESPVDKAEKMKQYLDGALFVNAIYFRSSWAEPFDKSLTEENTDFTLCDGTKVKVPMMHQKNQLFYFESDAYQAVKLPYGTLVNDPDGETIGPGVPVSDYEWEMILYLPKDGDADALLSAPRDDGYYMDREVHLWLPRFHLEWGYEEILPDLKEMGLPMIEIIAPGFEVLSVMHKAVVKVDEEGSEAAAVTAIEVGVASIQDTPPPPPPPVRLRFDRPFVFSIKHRASGAEVFVGKVMSPTDEFGSAQTGSCADKYDPEEDSAMRSIGLSLLSVVMVALATLF